MTKNQLNEPQVSLTKRTCLACGISLPQNMQPNAEELMEKLTAQFVVHDSRDPMRTISLVKIADRTFILQKLTSSGCVA